MSYIDMSRKSVVSAYEATVCLTKYDCTLLLPFIENTYKSVSKKADKYEEISTILPDTVVYWIKGGLIFATFKGVNRVETSRTTTLKPACPTSGMCWQTRRSW